VTWNIISYLIQNFLLSTPAVSPTIFARIRLFVKHAWLQNFFFLKGPYTMNNATIELFQVLYNFRQNIFLFLKIVKRAAASNLMKSYLFCYWKNFWNQICVTQTHRIQFISHSWPRRVFVPSLRNPFTLLFFFWMHFSIEIYFSLGSASSQTPRCLTENKSLYAFFFYNTFFLKYRTFLIAR
jgi:hypothetical protein